jgi:hypothetical protein
VKGKRSLRRGANARIEAMNRISTTSETTLNSGVKLARYMGSMVPRPSDRREVTQARYLLLSQGTGVA